LLGTVIEGTYFFRVIQTMYFKGKNIPTDKKESPVAGLIPMIIFAALIIFIGIYPNFIINVLNPAASELLNSLEYIRSVLG